LHQLTLRELSTLPQLQLQRHNLLLFISTVTLGGILDDIAEEMSNKLIKSALESESDVPFSNLTWTRTLHPFQYSLNRVHSVVHVALQCEQM